MGGLKRETRRALYTHAEGTNLGGEKFLVMYFRDRESGYGPFLFPIDEFLQDTEGREIKPAEYANIVLRRPDIWLQMEEALQEIARGQNTLHMSMREYAEERARGKENAKELRARREKIKQEAAGLEEKVKSLSPDNQLMFDLGQRRARIVLRERKKGYSFGRRDDERPNEDLEILLDQGSVDIEQVYWWEERSETDLVAISRRRGREEKTENTLIGYYPEHDYGLRLAEYVHVPDALELRLEIARRMLGMPTVVTQNGQGYDWRQLMKRGFIRKKREMVAVNDGIFLANIDNSQFFLEDRGHGEWGVRLRAVDRFEMDNCKAAEYYNDFLPDKKLETLDEFFTIMEQVDVRPGAGERRIEQLTFHKSLNYEELDRCRAEYDETGDVEKIGPRLRYAEEDTEVPLKIAYSLIPRLRFIAYATGTGFQSALNFRPAKLVKRWWDRVYFDKYGKPRTEHGDKKRRHLEAFDQTRYERPPRPKRKAQTDMFQEELDEQKPPLKEGRANVAYKQRKQELIADSLQRIKRPSAGDHRGIVRGVTMYHGSPISEALYTVLRRYDNIRKLKERLDSAGNAAQRIMYMEILDAFAREAVYDLTMMAWDQRHARQFFPKYGTDHKGLEKAMVEGIDERMGTVAQHGLVNQASNNFFMRKEMSDEDAAKTGMRKLGTVDLISLGRGRAIYRFQGMILRTGVKIPSKKARSLDERIRVTEPRVKTRIVRDFVEKCFEDAGEAVRYLGSAGRELAGGEGEIHDYIWRVRVREDIKYLTLESRKRENARIIRQLGGMKGEELFVIAVEDERGQRASDEQVYLGYDYARKGFYEHDRETGTRKPVSHDGKVFRTEDGREYRLCTGYYQDKICGYSTTKKGSKNESVVYEMMRVLMPEGKGWRELRERLAYGRADEEEIEMSAKRLKSQ
ncbi:TPA: hypothetical protein HA265_04380 [Candidatus Woesearchaeota archaeon]|nr:hypothetical protein [Candidatus Woesearchaeota archaeon]